MRGTPCGTLACGATDHDGSVSVGVEARVSHPSTEGIGRQLAEATEDAAMAVRLARDLPRCLARPLTLDDARRGIRERLAARERSFLGLVERVVYGHARSPYLMLLRHAGCEPGDLRKLILQEGLEGGLRTLADRGVYVTYDEFKGRRDAVRGSARFAFADRDSTTPSARRTSSSIRAGHAAVRPGPVGRWRRSPTADRRSLWRWRHTASAPGGTSSGSAVRCPGRWSTSDLRNRSTRGSTRSIRCPGARGSASATSPSSRGGPAATSRCHGVATCRRPTPPRAGCPTAAGTIRRSS